MKTPRKLVTSIVGLAALATIATGCKTDASTPMTNSSSSSSNSAPAPATPAATEQPADDSGITTPEMLVILWAGEGITTDAEHAESLARSTCTALEAGATWQQVAMTALSVDTPWTAEQIGYMIGSSVEAYCPEYSDSLGE